MGKKEKLHKLGDLQLAILRILWEHGPQPVAEIHRRLRGRRLAYTTVATMLRKMEARGLVQHTVQDRRFVYHALIEEDEAQKSALRDLVQRYFQGDVTAAVCNLLEVTDVSPEELEQLRKLIDEYATEQGTRREKQSQ